MLYGSKIPNGKSKNKRIAYAENAPKVTEKIFNLGIPVLGICYGMQLMTHMLGGKVQRADKREYGVLVYRQPFPGPGLAIRIIGDTTEDKLNILKGADYIFRDEIAKAKFDRSINQYFAVLTNIKSVGVMGNERKYDYTIALRAVTTSDFMTAEWTKIPYEVLEVISARIVNEVKHVNRVVYDITGKPPATIEWE